MFSFFEHTSNTGLLVEEIEPRFGQEVEFEVLFDVFVVGHGRKRSHSLVRGSGHRVPIDFHASLEAYKFKIDVYGVHEPTSMYLSVSMRINVQNKKCFKL